MKHSTIYRTALMALIAVAATACSSELTDAEGTQPQPAEPGEQITVIATQQTENEQNDRPQTRVNYDFSPADGTVVVTWAQNDVFYVGNDGWSAITNQAISTDASGFKSFSLKGGANTKAGEFIGPLPNNTEDGKSLYAIYGNDQMKVDQGSIVLSYSGQRQTANDNKDHLAGYDFMGASATYTKGQNPTFAFKRLGAMMKFALNLPGVTEVKELHLSFLDNIWSFTSEANWKKEGTDMKLGCEMSSNSITLTLGTNDTPINISGGSLTAYMMVAPTTLTKEEAPIDGKEILLAVKDNKGMLHTKILNGSEIAAGMYYTVTHQTLSPAFAGGSGTAADPYQISTAEQLRNLSRLVNSVLFYSDFKDKYYELTADIDLNNETWTPIGYESAKSFKGHFTGKKSDGSTPTISGLKIDSSFDNNGLFGCVVGGTISNITVSGSIDINGGEATDRTGSIAGFISNGTKLENCTSSCNITTNQGYTGGIVGEIGGKATLTDCEYTDTITTTGVEQPGGIVGSITINFPDEEVTLTGCSSTKTETIIGVISGTDSSGSIIIKKDESDPGITLPGDSGSSYPPILTPDGGPGDYTEGGDMFQ